jgi:hypothetical protein
MHAKQTRSPGRHPLLLRGPFHTKSFPPDGGVYVVCSRGSCVALVPSYAANTFTELLALADAMVAGLNAARNAELQKGIPGAKGTR